MTLLTIATLSWPTLLFLANVAIASLIVSALALIVTRYLPRNNLALRHAVLVGGLAVPLVTPLAFWMIGDRGLAMIRIRSGDAVVGTTHELTLPQLPIVGVARPRPDQPRVPDELAIPKAIQERKVATSQPAVVTDAPAIGGYRSWVELLQLAGTGLAMVWAAGCTVALLILARGIWQLRRMKTYLSPLSDPSLLRTMRQAADELHVRRLPQLCESDFVPAPLSVGLVRHRIVLPIGTAQSLSARQLQTLLRHELAHIARGDHLVGLLQRLARIAYWWNPLVHRVSTEVSFVREQICDDWATGPAAAEEYAQMLVDLAARVVRAAPLPTAIGIFESPAHEFSQRIQRLLEPGRSVSTAIDRRTRILGVSLFVALLSLGAIAPIRIQAADAEAPAAAAKSSEAIAEQGSAAKSAAAPQNADGRNRTTAEPVQWPPVLRGTINDVDGKPIAGARVRFDFEKIHEFNIGRWDETLNSQAVVTGDDGKYSFETSPLPNLTHRPFMITLTCTADGYADTKWWCWYTRDDTKLDETLKNVKMVPGRVVRGRCVDPNDKPISGATVKMASDVDYENDEVSWAWNPRETDDDGQFQFSVPRDSDRAYEVVAVHPQWAPQRASVPKSGDVLADIRLQRGGPAHGMVKTADGKPVAGAVVVAESVDDGTLRSVAFAAQVATRTDATGKYTLQPLNGLYKVYLSQAAKTDSRLERTFLVADEPPPFVVPARVALGGGESQELDFREGQTLTVRGAVHWANGQPAPQCKVQAGYLPPGNVTGIWIGSTVTKDDGSYSLVLPNPIDNVSIDVVGMHDDHHVWCSAFPGDKVVAKQKSQQNIRLNPLNGDVDGIDWVLHPEEKSQSSNTNPPLEPQGEGEIELEKLGRRYAALEQKCRSAMDSATPAEQFELFKTMDPRVLLADEYLALEEKYRGTMVGFSALVKLDQFAASVSDLAPKVPEARRELVDRLLKYYMKYPHLYLVLQNYNAGPQIERATELIRRAAEESPYRHVQAAALLYRAVYLSDRADAASQVGDVLAQLEKSPPANQAFAELLRKRAAMIQSDDPVAERAEAAELCRRVVRDYADVQEPGYVLEQDGLIRDQPTGASGPVARPGFKARAEGLLFNLEHLQVGMKAPELKVVGDNLSVPYTSYELRDGHVTVIAFLSYGQDALESELHGIAARHADASVDVVTVFNDMGMKPAGATTENPPRINVSGTGPVPWAVDSWPCIFVIDQQGIIRGRRLRTAPTDLINRLLANAPGKEE